jgi:tetratricopeptide (TPR) repeat protein
MLILFFLLLGSAVQALPSAKQPQSAAPATSAPDLKTYPEKQLFAMAESNIGKNGKSAHEAFRIAFEKRKGKEHKKYTPMFKDLSIKLADEEAAKGRAALSRNDLSLCEQHLKAAQDFLKPLTLTSGNVTSLEQSFKSKLSDLQAQFAKARVLADNKDFESALKILTSLLPHEKYLRDIKPTVDQANRSHIDYLVDQGWNSCSSRQWQEAGDFFQRALLKNPQNERAKSGITRVDRGRQADQLQATALKQLSEGYYREAVRTVDRAIATDPEAGELSKTKAEITSRWASYLEGRIPPLLTEKNDFGRSRDALLGLEDLGKLRPDHSLVRSNINEASRLLAGNSLGRADRLSQDETRSLAATAYSLLLSAKARQQADLQIEEQQLKSMAEYFNRKRFSLIVVSVDNESSAPENFVNSIRTRATNTIQNLNLPDLLVLPRDEYKPADYQDALFGNLRIDGKSSTALLTIRIDRHLWGTEDKPNPEYAKKLKQNDDFWEDVRKGKVKIKDKDAVSKKEQQKRELDLIPKEITVQDIRSYQYREIVHTRTTEVTLIVTVKDPATNEIMAREEIPHASKTTKSEITGVKEKDLNGLQNQALVMSATKEQALGQAERFVQDTLGSKLPGMLAPFTNRFLQDGKLRLNQQQREQAAEDFLCHWAFTHGRLGEDDATLIQDVVRQETGYDLRRFSQDFFNLVIPYRPTH